MRTALPFRYFFAGILCMMLIANLANANIPLGNYSVTVTNSGACSTEVSFLVDNNCPPIVLTATIIQDTCGLGTGEINL